MNCIGVYPAFILYSSCCLLPQVTTYACALMHSCHVGRKGRMGNSSVILTSEHSFNIPPRQIDFYCVIHCVFIVLYIYFCVSLLCETR